MRVGLTTEELNNTINYNQVAWDVGRCVETAVTLALKVRLNNSEPALAAAELAEPLIDSGTSRNLISSADAAEQHAVIRVSDCPLLLSTAKGIITSNQEAVVPILSLGFSLPHQVLPQTPHALSLGLLRSPRVCIQLHGITV